MRARNLLYAAASTLRTSPGTRLSGTSCELSAGYYVFTSDRRLQQQQGRLGKPEAHGQQHLFCVKVQPVISPRHTSATPGSARELLVRRLHLQQHLTIGTLLSYSVQPTRLWTHRRNAARSPRTDQAPAAAERSSHSSLTDPFASQVPPTQQRTPMKGTPSRTPGQHPRERRIGAKDGVVPPKPSA